METSVLQIPQGLANPERNVAYIVDAQGFISCLNLESGQIEARTDFPASPLTLDRGTVIGWRRTPDEPDAVRVFAATRQGNALRPKWEASLILPDWVEAGSADPTRFALEGRIEDGLVFVTWEAHARYPGGAPPPSGIEAASTRDERRSIRLNAETGAKVGAEQTEAAQRLTQDLPALLPNQRIVPYRSGASWLTNSWRVGPVEAFLATTTETPGVVLVRRDSSGAESPPEIRLTSDSAAVAAVTLDGRFIFIHEPGGEAPSWHLFSAETGERITRLPFDPGTEGVAVVNDLVLYLVVEETAMTHRRTLRCRNLRSADVMWSHLLREQARSTPPPLRP